MIGLETSFTETIPYDPSKLPLKTVIIGSRGRMGHMLIGKGRESGLLVEGVDLPFETGELEAVCDEAELVLLCVPAKYIQETVKKVIPFLPDNVILSDITSVKVRPMYEMEKIWQGKVVGTHPLFGPAFTAGDNLSVAIVEGKKSTKIDISKTAAFFQSFGCHAFKCSAVVHDKAMAGIQNLNFITNLAYFALLADNTNLMPFLTPSFQRRKQAAEKILNDDAELFTGLFEANDYSYELLKQFQKTLNISSQQDIEKLCSRAQWWWKI